MKNNGRYLVQDIIRLIDEFSAKEIELVDIKNWLKNHPCYKNDFCTREEKKILNQLKKLTHQPINENQWRRFKDKLKNN